MRFSANKSTLIPADFTGQLPTGQFVAVYRAGSKTWKAALLSDDLSTRVALLGIATNRTDLAHAMDLLTDADAIAKASSPIGPDTIPEMSAPPRERKPSKVLSHKVYDEDAHDGIKMDPMEEDSEEVRKRWSKEYQDSFAAMFIPEDDHEKV